MLSHWEDFLEFLFKLVPYIRVSNDHLCNASAAWRVQNRGALPKIEDSFASNYHPLSNTGTHPTFNTVGYKWEFSSGIYYLFSIHDFMPQISSNVNGRATKGAHYCCCVQTNILWYTCRYFRTDDS